MKRIVLAFAVMLAATSFAMAHEQHVKEPHYPGAYDQRLQDQRVDCWRDQAGRYYWECVAANATPLLGIDIDPFWIMQDLHP
ncbi:hypothetical protein [Mesorhizobium sp. ANAO-SY3R2]|uniref:hypothetical protein n=1 Tax=Mesorhizobium sp. ANAO-SY3R2 TaxID=3166644 RepID=UPI00366E81AB